MCRGLAALLAGRGEFIALLFVVRKSATVMRTFIHLSSDPFLPRVCELALTSSDRQTKVCVPCTQARCAECSSGWCSLPCHMLCVASYIA